MNHPLSQSDLAANATGEVFEASFTRPEVQKILKLSRPTLIKLFTSGELRAKKIGTQWRVEPKDLRAYLDGKSSNSEPSGES